MPRHEVPYIEHAAERRLWPRTERRKGAADLTMGARILIIEDDAASLALMEYLLEAGGHETLAAPDGEIGIELAVEASKELDLVICDLRLPRRDGFEVLRCMRQAGGLSEIPVVAVTAYAMVGDRERVLAAGFDGYLAKPIDPLTFLPQIEGWLRPQTPN